MNQYQKRKLREDCKKFDKWIMGIVKQVEEKPDTTDFDRRVNQLINRLNVKPYETLHAGNI